MASKHMKICSISLVIFCFLVAQLCLTLLRPLGLAHQVLLSVDFPRQENWSVLPFPSPGNIPDLGIELTSPALQSYSLPLSHQGNPISH